MKKLTIILGALIFISFATLQARLTVKPFKIEIKTDAGTYYENSWSLKNSYDRDIKVAVTASDLGSYEGNKNFSVEQWLKISPAELIIPKGQTAKVDYRVEISSQMQGSLAAQISFSISPEAGAMLIIKMSAPLHVIVRKTEKIDFSVENLTVSASSDAYKFNFSVNNGGNIIIKPQGEISVYKRKKLISRANMAAPSMTKSVFIGNSAAYQISVSTGLKDGKYRAEAKINAHGYESAKTASQKIEFKVLNDGNVEFIKKIDKK
ncbi:MAG: hypothetical protein LBU09_04415 [Endomicrobium sp.]|jgi:hypothetical protein|nr:hypothetical protein [Endomicrobium sp.]